MRQSLESASRAALVLLVVAGGGAGAQLTPGIGFGGPQKPAVGIPATPPTAVAPPSAKAPTTKTSRRADVTFKDGQLAVAADNSSLNQILREIGRTTGIKITGGVAEERVFGKYGPSSTAEVLNALLDGTGSNMLLVASESNAPGELVLTPRQGGVTPPNPNAPGFDDEGATEETQAPAFIPPSQRSLQRPVPQPEILMGAPNGTDVQQPLATAPGSVPPTATAPATPPVDPNGVKTPQQIYEQLQRLRQQVQPQE